MAGAWKRTYTSESERASNATADSVRMFTLAEEGNSEDPDGLVVSGESAEKTPEHADAISVGARLRRLAATAATVLRIPQTGITMTIVSSTLARMC